MNSEHTYNTIAHHFSQTRTHPWKEFSYYKKYIHEGDHLLDLGCGNGRLRHSLPSSIHYTGLDISEGLLTHAREAFPKDRFVHSSMTSLPFADHSFDVICAVASFQHLRTTHERRATLQECTRVLKPGGYLILSNWDLPFSKHKKNIFRTFLEFLTSFGKVTQHDYFIPWKDTQGNIVTMRYYRNITQKEVQQLITHLPLEIIEQHTVPASQRNRNRCFFLRITD